VTWSGAVETACTTTATEGRNGIIRWYDPITGRWLSNDPIGISGGLNQYVFCANNSVNSVDPLGKGWFPSGPDVPIGAIWGTTFDTTGIPISVGSSAYWHGNWGGWGWTAGQRKPESDLTPSDMVVDWLDLRDRGYRGHDIRIWQAGRHTMWHDMQLGVDLLCVPPWNKSFWMTSRGVPLPAPIEALFWLTGLPGLIN